MNRRIAVLSALLLAAVAATVWLRVTADDPSTSAGFEERCVVDEVHVPPPVDDVDPPVTLSAELVAELDQAVALIDGPAGSDELWATTKDGTVHAIADDGTTSVLLDIVDEVELGWEQGMLGLQLSPDETELFISYTDTSPASVIERMPIDDGRPVLDQRVEVFRLDQPHQWHNGGQIEFGPDDMLYAALGDGGDELDAPDVGRRAEDPSNLFGAILRLDVLDRSEPGYDVPPDNPFVAEGEGAPEVFVYGLRNPWRFSIDAESNRLWIGDVGHTCWEEINMISLDEAPGTDFGWPRLEGNHVFHGGEPHGHPPLHAYGRRGGRLSVTGGFVYRGDAIPALNGYYLYGDLGDGVVRTLRFDGERVERSDLGVEVPSLVSLHQGATGLYGVSHTDGVYRLSTE
ncbi:MAG: PQQ-dependent sugar dehydrogenase [Acidimicrobiales bacterium]